MKCTPVALITIVSVIILASACTRQEQVKAKIFERREMGDSSLVIRYEYIINNKSITDSATVRNIVISNDSIDLISDSKNPGKWIPDLNK